MKTTKHWWIDKEGKYHAETLSYCSHCLSYCSHCTEVVEDYSWYEGNVDREYITKVIKVWKNKSIKNN